MAAGGTPANVTLGPGRLYYAPIGTTEPVNCSSALPSAWKVVGYTEEGTEVSTELNVENIEVAEELEPIDQMLTSRTTTVTFTMVEATASRLALAMGAGAGRADDAASFEFPDTLTAVMLVWDSMDTVDATNRRWLFRQAKPQGTVAMARRKAPEKTGVAVTMACAKPSSTTAAVKVFPNSSGRV